MRLARIHGCLAGLALGDALGMPSEFLTPEQIRATFGRIDTLQAAPAWHPHHILRAGQVTDDTGQALAIAHA
ncbi:ADP-ribosylglycohydrolase family protein, partial [bacterium]